MNPPARNRLLRGFSLLELVIVVCIVALLAAVASERLMNMRVQAEHVAMESLLGTLRSALGIKVAASFAKGQAQSIVALVGSNPFKQLSETPENYRGEFYGIDPALVEGGQWYFDKREQAIVYRVRFEENFETGLTGPARIRHKVVPVYEDINNDQRFDPNVDKLTGVKLQALEPYRWRDSGP